MRHASTATRLAPLLGMTAWSTARDDVRDTLLPVSREARGFWPVDRPATCERQQGAKASPGTGTIGLEPSKHRRRVPRTSAGFSFSGRRSRVRPAPLGEEAWIDRGTPPAGPHAHPFRASATRAGSTRCTSATTGCSTTTSPRTSRGSTCITGTSCTAGTSENRAVIPSAAGDPVTERITGLGISLLGTPGEATKPSSRAKRGIPSLNGPLAWVPRDDWRSHYAVIPSAARDPVTERTARQ